MAQTKLKKDSSEIPSLDFSRLDPEFVTGLPCGSYTATALAGVIWEGCESLQKKIKDTANIASHAHLFSCMLVGFYVHYRLMGFNDEEAQQSAFGILNSWDFDAPFVALLPVEIKDIFMLLGNG